MTSPIRGWGSSSTRWAFETGNLSRERLERLEAFANSLERLPLSAASKARRWIAFLEPTRCGASSSWTAAAAWIAELENAAVRTG
jgi:hypothetical protein